MIVFCILRQAQSKVLVLILIDSEVSAYIFMNKFFAQQHHLFLHQLTHSRRLWEFDDQVALINDITHVVEITMILDEHIKKLFFYVIELINISSLWICHDFIITSLISILNTIFLSCLSSSVLIIVAHLLLRFMILINKKKNSHLKLTK